MPAQHEPTPEPAHQRSPAPDVADLIELLADPALSGYDLRGRSLPDLRKHRQASATEPAASGEAEPDGGNSKT
jgi:hypothetical protein